MNNELLKLLEKEFEEIYGNIIDDPKFTIVKNHYQKLLGQLQESHKQEI